MLIGDLYAELKAQNHVPPGTSLLQRAVQAALREVEGTYGIAVDLQGRAGHARRRAQGFAR